MNNGSSNGASGTGSGTGNNPTPRVPNTRPTLDNWNSSPKKPIETLNLTEVEALEQVVSDRSWIGMRDRTLIRLLHRSGLRLDECLSLSVKDVDLSTYTLRVLKGKGSKARTVPLEASTVAMLRTWLDRRTQLGLNGRHPIFCTLKGRKLAQQQVRAMLNRRAVRAGIDKRVHPHGMRHSYACHLMRRGVAPEHIRRVLGHANLTTTMRYLEGLGDEETMDVVRAVDWNRR